MPRHELLVTYIECPNRVIQCIKNTSNTKEQNIRAEGLPADEALFRGLAFSSDVRTCSDAAVRVCIVSPAFRRHEYPRVHFCYKGNQRDNARGSHMWLTGAPRSNIQYIMVHIQDLIDIT